MAVQKKTAAKPAAKKTTAAKTTAKKTATKTTAKSTAKPAAKPAAKPVVKKTTEISVTGNKKIKSLEKEFDTVFGLYAQVCYTTGEGKRYYTSDKSAVNDMTLAAFNAKCEKDGCKKGEWQ